MQFVYGYLAWLLGIILTLVVLDSLSYELFGILSLVGLLVVTELTVPPTVAPTWSRRLRWLAVLGLVGYAAFVSRKLVGLLPPEVLPW